MEPPSAEEASLERQLWAALARNQQLEGLLEELTRSRGVRALQGWWRLQQRARNVLRLARGTGKPATTRLRILARLLGELGPVELARALAEVVAAPSLRSPPEADAPPPELVVDGPLVSVLLPVRDPDPRWLAAALGSLDAQSYLRWELCLVDDGSSDPRVLRLLEQAATAGARHARLAGEGISRALNAALALARGDWVLVLDHDDELAPSALAWVAWTARDPAVDVIYSDEDKLDPTGRRVEPFFKPDWSPHYLLSTHYLGHLVAYRRALVEELGGFRPETDGAQDHDLALRAAPRARRIAHVPRLLYHWRQAEGSTALDADQKPWAREAGRRALRDALPLWGIPSGRVEDVPTCPGGYRVRPALGAERVAVIVPTRDRLDLLRPCLESVRSRSTYPHVELLVVDNGSRRRETLRYLEQLEARGQARVLRIDLPFNFALLVNRAAAATEAEVLCLLNNDVEVRSADWVESMLEALALPGVGAVGPRLVYPDGTLQHAGVVLGLRGVAGHAFLGRPAKVLAPGRRTSLLCNYSAVTGACLLIRREVYQALGGLDEQGLPNDYGDVDLCLRLGERGLRCVYTPFATLLHREGATRGRARDAAAEALLRSRYPAQIASDPYASPHFRSPAYLGG
ncbi:MAG: glycosyltransferase family 2 protein [Planctomycetota bacterium]